ncbi:hypothetical protein N8E89_03170 [Phyllobacterium sp. A18/5-2]|nr:hypothetical protein [Phyllobacterium sp. A18/5-2]UXN64825.1 hypothetical protein N8E89_03170 [Phyllobacterium sp. A18/5-2]
MAIKFALKDNEPKSASANTGKLKTEAKADPAPGADEIDCRSFRQRSF